MNGSLEPLQSGKSIKANIGYSNVGREPAPADIGLAIRKWSIGQWTDGSAAGAIAAFKDRCLATQDVDGKNVAYPTTGLGSGYNYIIESNDGNIPEGDRFVADDDVMKGDAVVAATACVSYKTVGEIHHTAMCYFYRANKTPSVAALNICDMGNAAD